MKTSPRNRLRGFAAILATLLSCLVPTRSFCVRPAKATLVSQSPTSSNGILNKEHSGFLTGVNNSPSSGKLARASAPKEFGGPRSEGFVTATVAALSTFAMSTLQAVLQRQLWVPPFGAVALIFAADAVAAAKEGKIMCAKTMWDKGLKACMGVATACFCTVAIANWLGSTPTMMRTTVMFSAAMSMALNPSAGYFPPAGALCALFVEKAVAKGSLPGFEYALFPCAIGVALLLVFSRVFMFALARPFRALTRAFDRKAEVLADA
mmetsp:Transcript_18691/g.43709  ORF Transcript_18691/g.43709 Transcript_18691/m.43709 type:complete len:265 (-) Transcript_18691:287-1081(-)